MAQEFDLGSVRGIQGERGLTGPIGPMGPAGPTPRVTVGETITLPAGSPAAVSRRPDSPDSAPVLDFAIPGGGSGGGDMSAAVYDPQNRHQDIFAYTAARDGKRGATIVVAASNSRDTGRADYVCSGEHDQLVLRTALNALPSCGGKLLLLEGDYQLTGYGVSPLGSEYRLLAVNTAHVSIEGQGAATVLRLADDVGEEGLTYCLLRADAAGFAISRLMIDGNSGGNSAGVVDGLHLAWNAEHSRISGCQVVNCSGCAMTSEAEQVGIHDNQIADCGDGLRLRGGVDLVYGNLIDGCANHGVSARDGEHSITGNRISNSGAIGIYVQGGSNHRIAANFLCDQPIGISLYLAGYIRLSGNDIRRNWSGNTYSAGEYSLRLVSCQYCLVVANRMPGKALSQESCTSIATYFSGTDWNIAF